MDCIPYQPTLHGLEKQKRCPCEVVGGFYSKPNVSCEPEREQPSQQGVPGINLLEGNLLIGSNQDGADSQTFSEADSEK